MKNNNDVNEEHSFLVKLQHSLIDDSIRVEKKWAKKWLLEDKIIIDGGLVFHLKIKDIGLGICEVSKAPLSFVKTFVSKK